MGAVAGMGPDVELEERSAPRIAFRSEVDPLEQVISPSRLLKKGARRRPSTVIHWLRRDSEVVRARR